MYKIHYKTKSLHCEVSVTNSTVICLLLMNLDGGSCLWFSTRIFFFYFFFSKGLWIKSWYSMENNSLLRVNCSVFEMAQTSFSFHWPLAIHSYPGFGEKWLGWEENCENNIPIPTPSISLATYSVSFAFVSSWSKPFSEKLETSA